MVFVNLFSLKFNKKRKKELVVKLRMCPSCGREPFTGKYRFRLGTTDGIYKYVICSHCNSYFRYKIRR